MPVVLRRVGVGAGEAQAPVGELRVGRPHLLAVEQPAAVVARSPRGRQRRRGRCPAPGSLNSWHHSSSASRIVGSQRGLLLVGAVREQRRADEVDADAADELRRPGAGPAPPARCSARPGRRRGRRTRRATPRRPSAPSASFACHSRPNATSSARSSKRGGRPLPYSHGRLVAQPGPALGAERVLLGGGRQVHDAAHRMTDAPCQVLRDRYGRADGLRAVRRPAGAARRGARAARRRVGARAGARRRRRRRRATTRRCGGDGRPGLARHRRARGRRRPRPRLGRGRRAARGGRRATWRRRRSVELDRSPLDALARHAEWVDGRASTVDGDRLRGAWPGPRGRCRTRPSADVASCRAATTLVVASTSRRRPAAAEPAMDLTREVGWLDPTARPTRTAHRRRGRGRARSSTAARRRTRPSCSAARSACSTWRSSTPRSGCSSAGRSAASRR